MTLYPIYLKMRDAKAVVVGGGSIGESRVESLLECGARVTVVSPTLTPKLASRAEAGTIDHVAGEFLPAHLEGAVMALAATEKADINSLVSQVAKERGILINVADAPGLCDFFLPAVVRRGELNIAISTGGQCPALAKKLRLDLEELFGPEYQELLQLLGSWRAKIRGKYDDPKERREALERVINSEILELIRRGETDLAEERIEQCI